MLVRIVFMLIARTAVRNEKKRFLSVIICYVFFFTVVVIKNIMIIKTWRQVKNKEKENGRK